MAGNNATRLSINGQIGQVGLVDDLPLYVGPLRQGRIRFSFKREFASWAC